MFTAQVIAVDAGMGGNTDKGTITKIVTSATDPTPNAMYSGLQVTNKDPITGGAADTTTQVIQQTDLALARTALTAQVSQDLDSALKAEAAGLGYAVDGQPSFTVTTDHKVGDQVPVFTMTMTATEAAIAFSQSQADALMRAALDKKIAKGFQLTADPIQTSYAIVKSSANGDVTIKGSAIGVVVPNVTVDQLKARIKGMQVDAARRQLERMAPGAVVDISIKPAVPWLPVLQDHISLTITIEPSTAG
jgi:hypothetical protein